MSQTTDSSSIIQTRIRKGERGASAAEYVILVAVLAALVVGALWSFGSLMEDEISDAQEEISDTLN